MTHKSHIEQLIHNMCPTGIEYKMLGDVTIWDKKFKEVDKSLQPETRKYHYYLANELEEIECADGDIRILYTTEKVAYTKASLVKGNIAEAEVVAIPWGGNATIKYFKGKFVTADNRIAIVRDPSIISAKFIYFWLQANKDTIETFYRGAGIKHPSMLKVLTFPIPVPPMEVQDRIVQIFESFTNLIDNIDIEINARLLQLEVARKVLLTNIKDDWQRKTLGDIGKVCMCKRILKNETNNIEGVPFFKISTYGGVADAYISKSQFEEYKRLYSYPKKGEILISAAGTIGKTVIFDGRPSYFQDSNIVWIANDESLVLNKYLYYYYQIVQWVTDDGGIIRRLYNDNLRGTKIPVPPLAEQRAIAEKLDTIEAFINNLKTERDLRQQQYEYYREHLINLLK